ncbi:MAG: hypothetical protein Q8S56_06315, partial [Polaromonas sp.]|nr:hypothetical protein [Polaromonas sp.]
MVAFTTEIFKAIRRDFSSLAASSTAGAMVVAPALKVAWAYGAFSYTSPCPCLTAGRRMPLEDDFLAAKQGVSGRCTCRGQLTQPSSKEHSPW